MTYDDAMRKVRALLNLADKNRGATPEEAANAAAKAQAIMDKFGIDTNDIDYDQNAAAADAEEIRNFGYEDPLDTAKYGNYEESWSVRLANIISQHNQCCIGYRRQQDKSSIIRIIGRPSDVQTARYLYAFFKSQIKDLQSKLCRGNSSAYKGQFCNGCIDTLAARLAKSREETFAEQRANNPLALVRVNGAIARIEKRMNDVILWKKQADAGLGICAGKSRFRGQSTELGGRAAGQEAGKSIRMSSARASLRGS